MTTFVLENLDEVNDGLLIFHKLSVDGICFYDEFCNEVEKNAIDKKQLNIIRVYMNLLAQSDTQLPSNKFNSIKEKGAVIGYEFKSKNLRVYVVKKSPNIFVILGGYKTNQKKDISRFSRIVTSTDFGNFINAT